MRCGHFAPRLSFGLFPRERVHPDHLGPEAEVLQWSPQIRALRGIAMFRTVAPSERIVNDCNYGASVRRLIVGGQQVFSEVMRVVAQD